MLKQTKDMELELKHLAAYLPYGLKYRLPLDSKRYDSIMEDEPFRLALPFMSDKEKSKHFSEYENMYLYQENPQIMWDDNKLFLGQMKSNLGFEEDDVYLNEVKPLLHPLSKLDLYLHDQFFKYTENFAVYDNEVVDLFCVENTLTSDDLTELNLSKLPYECVEYMFRNHYDVFGLIEAGLAEEIK